jgi:hypothetical protein
MLGTVYCNARVRCGVKGSVVHGMAIGLAYDGAEALTVPKPGFWNVRIAIP